jgi:hypothetical protein
MTPAARLAQWKKVDMPFPAGLSPKKPRKNKLTKCLERAQSLPHGRGSERSRMRSRAREQAVGSECTGYFFAASKERQMVDKLAHACRLLDDIFWRQSDLAGMQRYQTTPDSTGRPPQRLVS